MSGNNNYGYYYPPGSQSYTVDPNQNWSEWSLEQQQYNDSHNRMAAQHHANSLTHSSLHSNSYVNSRPQNFYNPNNRPYHQRRFNNATQQQFSGNQQQNNWQQRNNYNKRPRSQVQDSSIDNMEPKNKSAKKKKKPLSQNIPSKKDWTMEEAESALNVEKEYNKRYKNHALIIKFPDLELNRDIVSKFHPSIENVHFQQPSTPRFCFVTLQESADAEAVISTLNKVKFGDGYLTAEYKKDREEDQNIGPDDIDPCTLYVGNLAQEITKEDMVKTYPKGRRIDIGYAKKMKYTRYAFVSFKNVIDSIEAFKKTHSTQMYSKSLIVRFRRLHGTVGMPGESKPQNPAKSKSDDVGSMEQLNHTTAIENRESNNHCESITKEPSEASISDVVDNEASVTQPDLDLSVVKDLDLSVVKDLDLSVVKQEINSSDDENETNILDKTASSSDYVTPFMPGSINNAFEQHRPMIKKEVSTDIVFDTDTSSAFSTDVQGINIFSSFLETEPANDSSLVVKQEFQDPSQVVVKEEEEEHDDDDGENCDNNLGNVNFENLLDRLVNRSKCLETLRNSVS